MSTEEKKLEEQYSMWKTEDLIEGSMVDVDAFSKDEVKSMTKELDRRNIPLEEIQRIKAKVERQIEKQYSKMEVNPDSEEKEKLEKIVKNGASWFYWIAGLSLLNTIAILFDLQWGFPVGLGITQILDVSAIAFKQMFGSITALIAIIFDILIAGSFFIIGKFAHRPSKPAFITGMILYILDAILLLALGEMVNFGFHVFALIFIICGLRAIPKLSITKR